MSGYLSSSQLVLQSEGTGRAMFPNGQGMYAGYQMQGMQQQPAAYPVQMPGITQQQQPMGSMMPGAGMHQAEALQQQANMMNMAAMQQLQQQQSMMGGAASAAGMQSAMMGGGMMQQQPMQLNQMAAMSGMTPAQMQAMYQVGLSIHQFGRFVLFVALSRQRSHPTRLNAHAAIRNALAGDAADAGGRARRRDANGHDGANGGIIPRRHATGGRGRRERPILEDANLQQVRAC